MLESGELNPTIESETRLLLTNYGERLDKLFDNGMDIQVITSGFDKERAIRIRNSISLDHESVKFIFFADHDDTAEPYSIRKTQYIDSLITNLSGEEEINIDKMKQTFSIMNSVCRALPKNKLHPKRYSPLMEMIAHSKLIESIESGEVINFEVWNDCTEKNALKFINNHVLPILENSIGTLEENDKTYFFEKDLQALAVNWKEKPEEVGQKVWNLFVEHMTKPTILDNEVEGFDFDDSFHWVVSTFGDISFQAEKVINFLELIKKETGRIPDEILFFTRGRKLPLVEKVINEFSDEVVVGILDDSLGQLNKYAEKFEDDGRVKLLRAIRESSFRAKEKSDRFVNIHMEQGSLAKQMKELF